MAPHLGVETPELDKESEAKDAGSQIIGEFLDWLFNTRSVIFMLWDERADDELCFHTETVGEELDDLRRLQVELEDGDPSTVVPTARNEHPKDCARCGGTGVLRRVIREDWVPAGPPNITWWLQQYYDIDPEKADAERRALLEALREQHASD